MRLLILSMVGFVCIATSACSTSTASRGPRKWDGPKIAYVVSDRPLDDFAIHSKVTSELQERGYRVIDSKDSPPTNKPDALVVHYLDNWYWDVVMYLLSMDMRVLDGKTDEVIATALYKNSLFHTYPNTQKVTERLFKSMDEKGVF